MSTEIDYVALGDLCQVTKLAGFEYTNFFEYIEGGEIIAIRGLNVKDGRLDLLEVKKISKEVSGKLPRSRLAKNDILLTYTGTLGEVALIEEDNKYHLAPNVCLVRPEKVDPYYLYCFMRSDAFRLEVERLSVGSTQQTIPMKNIRQILVPLADKKHQEELGSYISVFDSKIQVDRETNKTLEAMAKALFKSWFVDFDPVRAKAEGRSTGLPAELSDLFPDSFEDSELGEIPSGWRVDSIYAVASVVYGAPFSSSLFNGDGSGIPVARIRDLPGESPGVYTTEVHPKGTLILPGDIVVGMDGEFRAYLWGGEECWMNQRVCKFIPGKKGRTCFLRESIRKPLMDVEMSETATTVIHLGKGDIDGFRVVVPTQEILDIFSAATTPLYEEVVANKQQIRVLANIRDALLPKLISGEIRIPDAEKMLEEVGI